MPDDTREIDDFISSIELRSSSRKIGLLSPKDAISAFVCAMPPWTSLTR